MIKNLSDNFTIFFKRIYKKLLSKYSYIFKSSLVCIICIPIFLKLFNWVIFKFNWNVVISNLPLFAFGSFPTSKIWRPIVWIIYIFILFCLSILNFNKKWINRNLLFGWISSIPLGVFLLYGGIGLTPVMTRNWGGLTLTIFLTICSLFLSLPIGIALAFCRQSSLIIVKKISSLYIDIMRAIPLISVLFFGQLLIPLFLPYGVEVDRVWRAIFAFTMFLSAYIAEDIRGGLQSIPYTQIEAANSLGLNQYQIMWFVEIPQSIQIALPALTNQSIGLLQNTSLMSILGLVELLGVGRSILANPEFIGQYIEVYIWLASVYWLICTMIAILSRNLEKKILVRKSYF